MVKTKMDFSKLRGRIVEKYGTMAKFSTAIDFGRPKLSEKMNSKRYFNTNDILLLCDRLDIPKEEIGDYFFTPVVLENRTEVEDGTDG